ncbi:MAG: dienelactone hydrolase family protein [Motilibacteraceae bacterium]
MAVTSSAIAIPTPGGELRGHLAVPAGDGPWPGVVVVHEAFGLDDDIRAHADRLAAAGYLALAPDLFSWGPTLRCLVAAFRALSAGQGRAVDDVEACRALLAARADCSGRVGILGFCMGGGFALLGATRGFDVAAPNYGQPPKDAERVLAGACPVVGSYGGRDRFLKGAATTLSAALTKNGVPHDVKEYPDASHSFLNRHTGFFAALDRVTGTGYREAAATDAWDRILAFFGTHLGETRA